MTVMAQTQAMCGYSGLHKARGCSSGRISTEKQLAISWVSLLHCQETGWCLLLAPTDTTASTELIRGALLCFVGMEMLGGPWEDRLTERLNRMVSETQLHFPRMEQLWRLELPLLDRRITDSLKFGRGTAIARIGSSAGQTWRESRTGIALE